MLQQPVNARLLPLRKSPARCLTTRARDARWIFHIGHVGSTLIRGCLASCDGVLAVREPRMLRDVALPARRAAQRIAPTFSGLDFTQLRRG